MRNSRKASTAAIIGGIFVLTTLVIYFFGNTYVHKTGIDRAALSVILLSEIILFGSMAFLNLSESLQDKAFIKAGIITTLSFYWLITTIFALVLKNAYSDNISGFFTVEFVILAVAVCISIIIGVSYESMSAKNHRTLSAEVTIKKAEDMAKLLLTNTNNLPYKNELNKIYEDIRYSDKSKAVSEDSVLCDKLLLLAETLQDASDENKTLINNYIDEVRQIIKQRNLAVRALNQGGI